MSKEAALTYLGILYMILMGTATAIPVGLIGYGLLTMFSTPFAELTKDHALPFLLGISSGFIVALWVETAFDRNKKAKD